MRTSTDAEDISVSLTLPLERWDELNFTALQLCPARRDGAEGGFLLNTTDLTTFLLKLNRLLGGPGCKARPFFVAQNKDFDPAIIASLSSWHALSKPAIEECLQDVAESMNPMVSILDCLASCEAEATSGRKKLGAKE